MTSCLRNPSHTWSAVHLFYWNGNLMLICKLARSKSLDSNIEWWSKLLYTQSDQWVCTEVRFSFSRPSCVPLGQYNSNSPSFPLAFSHTLSGLRTVCCGSDTCTRHTHLLQDGWDSYCPAHTAAHRPHSNWWVIITNQYFGETFPPLNA